MACAIFFLHHQCNVFLNLANSCSVLLSQTIMSTDPLHHNLTVSARLHCRPLPWDSGFLALCRQLFHQFLFCVPSSGSRYPAQKCDESFLIFKCMAYCCFTCPILLTGPLGSQSVPDTPSIVPTTLVFPPCVVVRVAFHSFQMLAWTATISCFSIMKPASRC